RMALLAHEDGKRHAPDALARDAPVGPLGDHVGDAVFAPRRVPDHALDLVERALAEGGCGSVRRGHWGFHRDEPLFGGAEDERVVAAPSMRVAVADMLGAS